MAKFYIYLWFFWVIRMLVVSTLLAGTLSFFITFYFYAREGLPAFESEILTAILNIFTFWFLLLLNFALPLALFINTKYLFNNCINAISLRVVSCAKEEEFLERIGYGDLIKIWRKWLLLIVWISSVFVLFSFLFFYFLLFEGSFFEWLSVYCLYGFILLSGFFALPLLGSRCKSVRLRLC